MSSIFDTTTKALGSAINFRQLRHNVISSNVSNAETPGYKAKKLDFEEALSRAVDLDGLGRMTVDHADHYATGPGSISKVRADIYDNPDINVTNDKNTVDMEREMSDLAENSIMYKAALQLINKKLAALRYAATEGGR